MPRRTAASRLHERAWRPRSTSRVSCSRRSRLQVDARALQGLRDALTGVLGGQVPVFIAPCGTSIRRSRTAAARHAISAPRAAISRRTIDAARIGYPDMQFDLWFGLMSSSACRPRSRRVSMPS